MKPGPSEDYKALLRGEITSEEYIKRMKADVDAQTIIRSGKMPPRRPVTMALADELEAAGSFDTAEIARKYAVDRPRWWHRFIRRRTS